MKKFGSANTSIGSEYFAMSSAKAPLKAGAKLKLASAR